MSERTVSELAGKRVTLIGLGKHGGGVGVARYLAEQGAVVTVTDAKPAEELAESVHALDGLPVRFVLGEHDEADFTPAGADVVVRNPSVPRQAPLLELARATGVPVEMEMSLFLRHARGPVIGITGTKGKTTTSTMLAAMLQSWKPETALAGNMGISALALLPELTADQPVVLELSSWQLEGMDEHHLSPHIAVLTNISPDHLNTYPNFDAYADTKRRIAAHQTAADFFVVNADDREARRAIGETPGRSVPFGRNVKNGVGMIVNGRTLNWRFEDQSADFSLPAGSFALAGDHQVLNVAAAATAALLQGAPPEAVEAGIAAFDGIPNRNEFIAEIEGVTFVNDTTATAPSATIVALERFAGKRIHLISGGANKALDLQPLADAIRDRAASVSLIDGSATPLLIELLGDTTVPVHGPFRGMESAVEAAASDARQGDIVLLAPGVASFGIFIDEFDRGEQFRAVVNRRVREASTS